jgi:Fic family protein
MEQGLDQFEAYLHAPSTVPLLIRLAAIHYQFEAIHPFLDGNGRIGRLLITLLLCKEGALPEPLLYLSAYFERYRNEYYRLLLAVSQSGKWIDWISFFLRGVAEQSRDALVRSDRLLQLWKNYRGEFQSARSSALQLRLVDQLFAYPAITANQAAKLLKVTHRSAQLNIEKLIRKGILKEATGKQRNRVFIAPQIVKIIEATHAS